MRMMRMHCALCRTINRLDLALRASAHAVSVAMKGILTVVSFARLLLPGLLRSRLPDLGIPPLPRAILLFTSCGR